METVEKILKALEDFSKKETFLKTYGDVFSYAEKYGGVTSNAFQKHLAEVLVDGYLPKDEAEKAIKPALIKMSEDISNKAASVQQLINSESGVGLKAIQSGVNHDKINGIVNRVSSEPYDDIKWIVKEPVINFAQAAVSDTQKANMEWQSKAGLKPRIERKVVGECCKWCSDLAGVYEYPEGVPDDIYKRHERCRCVTEYIGNGKRQDVWSKEIKEGKPLLKMDLQLFAEENIKDIPSPSLSKGIKSFKKNIRIHEDKINNPQKYINNWDSFSAIKQNGYIKHWKKEIDNFNDSIYNRIEELKRRGDYNE